MKLSNLIPFAATAAIFLPLIFTPSGCASTKTPPSGGPKDTIPPVLMKASPFPGDTLVDRNKTKVVFTFDEYVKIKSAASILLSPPQQKRPISKIKGKSVVITFEEPLDSSRTYTIDLTGAIVDNNEGNPFPGFTLVFSTGNRIDSMVLTGTVRDCSTLLPVEGATVLLYKDHADSAVMIHRPDAAVKTDAWGYFSLRNIEDTIYRVYAIKDVNNNFIFDPATEQVAFLDTLLRPSRQVSDTLIDIMKFDMKDTLGCMSRTSEVELSMFRPLTSRQMVRDRKRIADRAGYISFMARNVELDSLWIEGVPNTKFIRQINAERDSIEFWIDDPRPQPDTLALHVIYMKTDSTGALARSHEDFRLTLEKKTSGKSSRRDLKHEDTLNVMKIVAQPERVEQYGFEIEFNYPQNLAQWDSLKLRSINPKQKESPAAFDIEIDTLNLRKFSLHPREKMQKGYEYILKVPHRKFRDINGFWNDSLEVKVSLPNDDDLSSLTLNLSGVEEKYIVDLLDEARKKTIRSFIIDKPCSLLFPYLKEGKYNVRFTEDINRNGIVDTGDLLTHRQPEKVLFYKIRGDETLIEVPKRMEIEQNIDLKEMFK